MAKFLKFSVAIQTGRTFELPLDKAIEFIKENTKEDISNWNETDLADFLYNQIPDYLDKYEKENCYYETHIQDEEIEEV